MIASLERKPLGQLLLNKGLIKPEDLERALEEQKRSNHQKLLGEVILTVAIPEPANVFLLEEIERVSGYQCQVVAATAHDIRATLQTYLPTESVFVIDEVNFEEFSLVETQSLDINNLEQAAGDSPVIKLVNYCIYNAVKEGASDIHIEPGDHALRIRYRIDGRLFEKLRPPFQMHAAVISRIKIMAGLDIAERRLPQDGSIHVMMDKRPVDLRVATLPGKHGEKLVIRVIDNDRGSINLERLGFSYETLKQWRKLIGLPNGILLVTGPTGSGKSTTLYASLQELNEPDVNICTVEDPIEYAMAGVNQFQVQEKIGFTFANALRALLRQDPDILMVGEIRDGDTARIATQAALTGHLVLSTLHTNDAPGAITRLFNLGIEPYLVGATTAGVLAQRLVRKLCQTCKEAYEPNVNERRQLEKVVGTVEMLYRSRGCPRCRNRGFSGRIGIYELVAPDDQMFEKICAGASLNEIRECAKATGMKPLRLDGLEKVKAGLTTLDEIYRVTA